MTYSTANSGTTTWNWSDRTIGFHWSPVTLTNTAYYYTGNAADIISERVSGDPLRQFSTQYFTAAGAFHGSTSANFFSLPYDYARLTNGQNTMIYSNIETGSTNAFHQTFVRCQ